MEKELPKKRGRKPKGGKLIDAVLSQNDEPIAVQNVILHLKCSLIDITTPSQFSTQVKPYEKEQYHIIHAQEPIEPLSYDKRIAQKLSLLSQQLHHSNYNTCSDCFWCHHSFPTPTIYIPRYKIGETYYVYGSFCCPECAAAHLFKEQIDTSTKFERYQLLNYIYGSVYDYKKNITPAPYPYHLLEKYNGNLTIHEYRRMLTSDSVVKVMDKPICKVFPEVFQDNQEYSIPNFNPSKQSTKVYNLCRKGSVK